MLAYDVVHAKRKILQSVKEADDYTTVDLLLHSLQPRPAPQELIKSIPFLLACAILT